MYLFRVQLSWLHLEHLSVNIRHFWNMQSWKRFGLFHCSWISLEGFLKCSPVLQTVPKVINIVNHKPLWHLVWQWLHLNLWQPYYHITVDNKPTGEAMGAQLHSILDTSELKLQSMVKLYEYFNLGCNHFSATFVGIKIQVRKTEIYFRNWC